MHQDGAALQIKHIIHVVKCGTRQCVCVHTGSAGCCCSCHASQPAQQVNHGRRSMMWPPPAGRLPACRRLNWAEAEHARESGGARCCHSQAPSLILGVFELRSWPSLITCTLGSGPVHSVASFWRELLPLLYSCEYLHHTAGCGLLCGELTSLQKGIRTARLPEWVQAVWCVGR